MFWTVLSLSHGALQLLEQQKDSGFISVLCIKSEENSCLFHKQIARFFHKHVKPLYIFKEYLLSCWWLFMVMTGFLYIFTPRYYFIVCNKSA